MLATIPVNEIIKSDGIGEYGFIFNLPLLISLIDVVFNEESAVSIKNSLETSTGGISLFHVFGQFIVYFSLSASKDEGGLVFIDCKNDIDIALDTFNKMKGRHGWSEKSRKSFMEQFTFLEDKYEDLRDTVVLIEV